MHLRYRYKLLINLFPARSEPQGTIENKYIIKKLFLAMKGSHKFDHLFLLAVLDALKPINDLKKTPLSTRVPAIMIKL